MRWPRLLSPAAWPLPGGCWVCRAWGLERVCTACLERFNAPKPRCPRCALPLAGPHCAHCLREPLPLQRVHCALDYAPPWDELLLAFKHKQAIGLLPALGQALCKAVQHELTPGASMCLLPVPLHPARLGARGFNQSALLARYMGEALKLPVASNSLRRAIDTPAQAALNRRERLLNLRHAFVLEGPLPAPHCVLVDDVMTTGATLATLAGLLLKHGATRVDAWVLARTPDPLQS